MRRTEAVIITDIMLKNIKRVHNSNFLTIMHTDEIN